MNTEKEVRFKYLGIWSDWMPYKSFVECTKDIFNKVEEVEEYVTLGVDYNTFNPSRD